MNAEKVEHREIFAQNFNIYHANPVYKLKNKKFLLVFFGFQKVTTNRTFWTYFEKSYYWYGGLNVITDHQQ